MKHEKLSQALSHISDSHIAEASAPKKKVRPVWFGAVAAILAAAVLAAGIWIPLRPGSDKNSATCAPGANAPAEEPWPPQFTGSPWVPGSSASSHLLASPSYPELAPYQYWGVDGYEAWRAGQQAQYDQPADYASGTGHFFRESLVTFLGSDNQENTVCSPLNVYMALAMLAQCTDGESRQQILDLLGADSVDALQVQAGHIWNAHYRNDGLHTALFANSLWLDQDYSYNTGTVNTLSRNYYASVYRGDLGSPEMDAQLQGWLNDHTQGLLQEQSQNIKLDPTSVLALASTVYYSADWTSTFQEDRTSADTFHSPAGDVETLYMHSTWDMPYYWGENFGAVCLYLGDGSTMWLILPDEGVTTSQVLNSADWSALMFDSSYPNQKNMAVELAVPRFDVASQMDIREPLQTMGITDVTDPNTADFSPILPDAVDAYMGKVNHAVRVAIDEEGIQAAAFTVVDVPANAAPWEDLEAIQFTLDRPFLFLIESRDGLPLFAGIVNEP